MYNHIMAYVYLNILYDISSFYFRLLSRLRIYQTSRRLTDALESESFKKYTSFLWYVCSTEMSRTLTNLIRQKNYTFMLSSVNAESCYMPCSYMIRRKLMQNAVVRTFKIVARTRTVNIPPTIRTITSFF